jgi:alkylation response protein AidB-like acyl-CoA dehydrogenase
MTERLSTDHESDEQFGARLRGWLVAHYPEEWRHKLGFRLRGENEKQWLSMLYRNGWRAPSWPREHGGLELSFRKQLIYHSELEWHGAARFIDFGGALLGPTLIRYGTPEQKQRYLPPILSGESLWCQGYSEPNAGSDLANLSLQAVREGNNFVLNGSKIWTTHANDANHIFLLARTSRTERKQDGISFFLLDMDTPGIIVQPIINLAGEDEFSQVFFDDVRVSAANLVHEVDKGWQVARSLLGIERIMNGSPHLSKKALAVFHNLAAATGQDRTPAFREARVRLACELHNAEALYTEICEATIRGDVQSEMFSMMKVIASELFQRVTDTVMQFAHEHAGEHGQTEINGMLFDLHRIYMMARPATIYSGANEVQRNIIARSVLG